MRNLTLLEIVKIRAVISCVFVLVNVIQVSAEGGVTSACAENLFQCQNDGLCIQASARCNGKQDCSGGEDENNCETCSAAAFHCSDKKCIQATQQCDDHSDCDDKSDETNCRPTCPTADRTFACDGDNTLCLPAGKRCDGLPDCWPGTDEQNCTSCSGNAFHCGNNNCIDGSLICDGTDHCGDGSDESLSCKTNCPSERPFNCRNTTTCLLPFYRCDGMDDCGDNSDEENCATCIRNSFHCANNKCVHISKQCDGMQNDCEDNSDESNCSKTCPVDRSFLCKNSTQCIEASHQCDGSSALECADGSDESNCQTCPSDRPFHCAGDTRCIQASAVCDWYQQCNDGSDEANCNTCPSERPFHCQASTMCISSSYLCDGTDQCRDGDGGSDEANCTACPTDRPFLCGNSSQCINPKNPDFCGGNKTLCLNGFDRLGCAPCSENQFKCYDGKCLAADAHCNGNLDCSNGEDEQNCDSCINGGIYCEGFRVCKASRNDCPRRRDR